METWKTVAIGILITIALFVIISLSWVISVRNSFVQQENGIKAQYEQNKNSYDKYFKTIKEMVQVPEMYTSDFRSIIDKSMTGRYGQNGSKAVFQWLKEHEISLPHELYTKIQTAIEGGRTNFANDQTILVDKIRLYKNFTQIFPKNILAGLLHYPKINFPDYDIVTSEETQKVFQEKKSEVLQLRDKKKN